MKNPEKIPDCLKQFGLRIRRLRKNANLLQADLANKLDVGVSAINKYEKMPNSFPSIPILLRLSEIFNVSTDYLLKGIDAPSFVSNNINGELNNSSFVQANHGGAVMNNSSFSPEAEELANIYIKLKGRERIKLINYAMNLEEGAMK